MSFIALIFANDANFAMPLVADGWDVVAVGTDAGWFSGAVVSWAKAFDDATIAKRRTGQYLRIHTLGGC